MCGADSLRRRVLTGTQGAARVGTRASEIDAHPAMAIVYSTSQKLERLYIFLNVKQFLHVEGSMIGDTAFQWEIRADQLPTMAQQIPGGIVGGLLAAWILAFLFRDQFQDSRVLYWVITVTFIHLVLFTSGYISYRRAQSADHETDIWGFRFTFVSGTAALAWGSIGVIFFYPAHTNIN